jgi:hypothetical protein
MNMNLDLLQTIVTAAFSAGGAYYAVRTELRWLRSDVDDLKQRVTKLETDK